jgi:shikimate kinase
VRNESDLKLVLTGFMGVGKSSVARHLAHRLRCKWTDLDRAIEDAERSLVAKLIDGRGIDEYRKIETRTLERVVGDPATRVLSLGGGTWTIEGNRQILKDQGFRSIWLDASFEHCWLNITFSRKERPLARDKNKARALFEERQKVYCLADFHFVVKPDLTSYELARTIANEMFS